jgi:hypothetical protein
MPSEIKKLDKKTSKLVNKLEEKMIAVQDILGQMKRIHSDIKEVKMETYMTDLRLEKKYLVESIFTFKEVPFKLNSICQKKKN